MRSVRKAILEKVSEETPTAERSPWYKNPWGIATGAAVGAGALGLGALSLRNKKVPKTKPRAGKRTRIFGYELPTRTEVDEKLYRQYLDGHDKVRYAKYPDRTAAQDARDIGLDPSLIDKKLKDYSIDELKQAAGPGSKIGPKTRFLTLEEFHQTHYKQRLTAMMRESSMAERDGYFPLYHSIFRVPLPYESFRSARSAPGLYSQHAGDRRAANKLRSRPEAPWGKYRDTLDHTKSPLAARRAAERARHPILGYQSYREDLMNRVEDRFIAGIESIYDQGLGA